MMESLEVEEIVEKQLEQYLAKEKYETKDSGERIQFEGGAVRDTQEGKTRWDLIPVVPLKRLADLYARGAVKYSERNWEKGFPFSRVWASLLRHLFAYWMKVEDGEDHGAGAVWNMIALMFYEDRISKGLLPRELDDREQCI